MTDKGRISKLESLLERVLRNARAPRVRAPHPAPAPAETTMDLGGGAPARQARAATPAPVPARPQAPPPPEVVGGTLEIVEDVEILDELEVVELPSEPAAAAAGGVVDIDFDDMQDLAAEEPPASSRRPKLAETMDAALAGAAEQLEEEREVPIKTPPPESGPQEAVPAAQMLQAPALPKIEDLLEQRPVAPPTEPTPSPSEVEIAEAEPPPLSAQRATVEARLEPEVTSRPASPTAAEPASFIHAAQAFQPQTFAELLDASLKL